MIPRNEGVKVRSAPRKLLEAVQSWAGKPTDTSFFIGAVQYHSEKDILQRLANLIRWPNSLYHFIAAHKNKMFIL